MSDSAPAEFQAPAPEQLAPLFPGYQIDSLLATGGMGAVYRAVQLSLDRTVAIKILPREFGDDPSFRSSFEAEAKAMARLNHPNLIGVYDFGEAGGMLYILMEFVPGKSLFHSAYGKIIAPHEAARIVSEVCQGLAHAHEAHILHRDIKPGNILLDAQARPKIGDFGLARPMGRNVEDGETIFGTPHYTAPEVIKTPHAVDARADIFSIGVVLHELLTGKLPADDPRPPSAISGCDPRFDVIVRRATHPSPELRYSDANTMAEELDAIRSQKPASGKIRNVAAVGPRPITTAAHAAPTPRPVTYISKKSSGIPTALAGIGVAAAVVVALFMILGGPKDDLSEPTVAIPEPASDPSPTPQAPATPSIPEPEPEIVQVEPEPEPEPQPVVLNEPQPEPEPDIVSIDNLPPVIPAFDVPAFLERARSIMRQRATPILDQHQSDVSANFDAFERKIKRAVRDLDNFRRPVAEPLVEQRLTEWRADGNRIPESISIGDRGRGGDRGGDRGRDRMRDWDRGNTAFYDNLDAIHAEFYPKQNALDRLRDQQITELAKIYILGLDKEIERRVAVADEASEALLKSEINTTRDDPSHFRNLMAGSDFKTASTVDD